MAVLLGYPRSSCRPIRSPIIPIDDGSFAQNEDTEAVADPNPRGGVLALRS